MGTNEQPLQDDSFLSGECTTGDRARKQKQFRQDAGEADKQ